MVHLSFGATRASTLSVLSVDATQALTNDGRHPTTNVPGDTAADRGTTAAATTR